MEGLDPRADFLRAATWHGTLETAAAILAAHPEIASVDIYTAAILGDAAAVQRFLALDPANATAQGGPRGWDALTYLCFSKYLLLERGADPNDGEVPYHAPETHDNAALQILVESGKLNPDSLGTILLRKTDWHDYEGIKWLLERGVDPNRRTRWGKTALHNAVLSDNALEIFQVLLDHGADPTLIADRPERSDRALSGRSAVAMAARRGRGDVLELFERRGIPVELQGVERLLAA